MRLKLLKLRNYACW